MNWLDFSIDMSEKSVKYYKKILRGQLAFVGFNLGVFVYDVWDAIHNISMPGAFGIGAMLVSSLWTIAFACETYGDIRYEKQRIKFLKEMQDNNLNEGEKEQYKNAAENYERVSAQLREKINNLNKGETP